MKVVILAHGVLGFGKKLLGLDFLPVPSFLSYFRGVEGSVNQQVVKVVAPTVNSVGDIATRGDELKGAILNVAKEGHEVYVIAHSMGGLDFMHAYKDPEIQRVVKGVACIGTPFLGSEVADAIKGVVDPDNPKKSEELLRHVPKILVEKLTPALGELTTRVRKQNLELCNTKLRCPGFLIAGDATNNPASPLFHLTKAIGQYSGHTINDGVVTDISAHYPSTLTEVNWQVQPNWPFDHGGEIGWFMDSIFSLNDSHIDKYHDLIQLLTGIDKKAFKNE